MKAKSRAGTALPSTYTTSSYFSFDVGMMEMMRKVGIVPNPAFDLLGTYIVPTNHHEISMCIEGIRHQSRMRIRGSCLVAAESGKISNVLFALASSLVVLVLLT